MLVLVLDTATPAVTAALVQISEDDRGEPGGVTVLAARVTVDGRAHGELLAPQIDEVLAEAGAKPADLAAIVAGVGPGPFTGLRVGLVTAASFGTVLGIPTYGVCTLDALAWDTTGPVVAATDARRREVYWARYHDGARVSGPDVTRPADVAPHLAADGILRGVGAGAGQYAEVLGVAPEDPQYPPPYALAGLAADRIRSGAPGEVLTPLYLRRPDAVEPSARKSVLAPSEA